MRVRPFISICVRLTSDRERFRLSCDGFGEKLGKNKAPPCGDGGRTPCPFCGMSVLLGEKSCDFANQIGACSQNIVCKWFRRQMSVGGYSLHVPFCVRIKELLWLKKRKCFILESFKKRMA